MKIAPPTTNAPSRKRTKVVIATLILICVAALTWLLRPAVEPKYNGKPFGLWLEEYSRGRRSSDSEKAVAELGKMGTNALPIIVHTLERNHSPTVNIYREYWPGLPSLLKTLLPKPKPEMFSVIDAEIVLQHLAPANFASQLRPLARSHNPAVRELAFRNIGRNEVLNPRDSELLLLCRFGLRDPLACVRHYSANLISSLGPAASNAVPELIEASKDDERSRNKNWPYDARISAAIALGRIGPAAASSVPALTNLLTSSSDPEDRMEVASALWHITSNETIALSVLIHECSRLEPKPKRYAIGLLKEMGPRATNSLPMLLNELKKTNNDGYTLSAITNAMLEIDPEAAAKAGVK